MRTVPIYGDYNRVLDNATVDDEDYEKLILYKWNLSHGYAMFNNGSGTIYMHRLVNNTPKGYVCDHINRIKLDNRKENLRAVTHRENSLNSGRRFKSNKTGYTGVYFNKENRNYYSLIRTGKRRLYLGAFATAELASKAYQEAIKEHQKIIGVQ